MVSNYTYLLSDFRTFSNLRYLQYQTFFKMLPQLPTGKKINNQLNSQYNYLLSFLGTSVPKKVRGVFYSTNRILHKTNLTYPITLTEYKPVVKKTRYLMK